MLFIIVKAKKYFIKSLTMIKLYVKIHSERNLKEGIPLTKQNISVQEIKILDEIVNNAIGLPVESQNLLLLMAKGMSYTKKCLLEENRKKEESLK